MADVAVVIPVLNEAERLGALLSRLRAEEGVAEIVVVDGGSADRSFAIAAAAAGVRALASARGRGRQIAAGVAATSAPLIWTLHADCIPPPGAVSTLRALLTDPNVALACFPIAFDAAHPLLALYGALSRIDSGATTFGDQGFCFRRRDWEIVGGCPPWAFLEDVELRRRLVRRGRVAKARARIVTSARRFLAEGLLRRQLRNAMLLFGYWIAGRPLGRY